MKKCSFCAEEIQDEAIICRYCKRELKPRFWEYFTMVLHYRNMDEGGWLNSENTPAALAAQHFWDSHYQEIAELDKNMISEGWEIVEPHGPACVQVENERNSKGYDRGLSVVSAIFSGGASLIGQAIGFYKWWPSSLTMQWRNPADEDSEEIYNLWLVDGEFERIELNADDGKYYLWTRPEDYDDKDPDDNRWDKTLTTI